MDHGQPFDIVGVGCPGSKINFKGKNMLNYGTIAIYTS
jgi:hypothetical protein